MTGSDRIGAGEVLGTWRLVASSAVDRDGKPIADPWGPEPMGRLVLTPAGRMMAVLCDGRTSVPDGAERSYSSYCGNFTFDGFALSTTVDAASDTSRIGSVQIRRTQLRDGMLVLSPPPRDDGDQRELIWALEARPHQ